MNRKGMKAPRGYAYYGGSEYEDMFMMVNGQPHLISDDSLKFKIKPMSTDLDSTNSTSYRHKTSSMDTRKDFVRPTHL